MNKISETAFRNNLNKLSKVNDKLNFNVFFVRNKMYYIFNFNKLTY